PTRSPGSPLPEHDPPARRVVTRVTRVTGDTGRVPQQGVDERAARVRFRRALTLMGFTLLVPGSAQLVAGNRQVGRIAVRIWLATLAVLVVGGVTVWWHRPFGYWLAFNADVMLYLRLYLLVGAVAWAALFIDAWRIG